VWKTGAFKRRPFFLKCPGTASLPGTLKEFLSHLFEKEDRVGRRNGTEEMTVLLSFADFLIKVSNEPSDNHIRQSLSPRMCVYLFCWVLSKRRREPQGENNGIMGTLIKSRAFCPAFYFGISPSTESLKRHVLF
jgi:hypothetical protein